MTRARAVTKESVSAYFKNLDEVIKNNDLENSPELIWNIDESGVSTEHSPPRVVGPKGRQIQSYLLVLFSFIRIFIT